MRQRRARLAILLLRDGRPVSARRTSWVQQKQAHAEEHREKAAVLQWEPQDIPTAERPLLFKWGPYRSARDQSETLGLAITAPEERARAPPLIPRRSFPAPVLYQ
jgi:hypothetical protein